MDMDALPDNMKLNFVKTDGVTYKAEFPFGEYIVLGPNKNGEYFISFTLNVDGFQTFSIEKPERTARAAIYVAKKFHVENTIPKLIEIFEEENAN